MTYSLSSFLAERQQLRRQLRQRRCALDRAEQQRAALHLYRQLSQHPWFRRARHVALYMASDGEISPQLLLDAALKRGKAVYLPVIAASGQPQMKFQQLHAGTRWHKNRFGILEPVPELKRQRPVWTLDLLCMPLVGFDERGGRLGMGGGYYDRCLAEPQLPLPRLLGLAHACQQVEQIPRACWDIPLDAVATDQNWFDCLD